MAPPKISSVKLIAPKGGKPFADGTLAMFVSVPTSDVFYPPEKGVKPTTKMKVNAFCGFKMSSQIFFAYEHAENHPSGKVALLLASTAQGVNLRSQGVAIGGEPLAQEDAYLQARQWTNKWFEKSLGPAIEEALTALNMREGNAKVTKAELTKALTIVDWDQTQTLRYEGKPDLDETLTIINAAIASWNKSKPDTQAAYKPISMELLQAIQTVFDAAEVLPKLSEAAPLRLDAFVERYKAQKGQLLQQLGEEVSPRLLSEAFFALCTRGTFYGRYLAQVEQRIQKERDASADHSSNLASKIGSTANGFLERRPEETQVWTSDAEAYVRYEIAGLTTTGSHGVTIENGEILKFDALTYPGQELLALRTVRENAQKAGNDEVVIPWHVVDFGKAKKFSETPAKQLPEKAKKDKDASLSNDGKQKGKNAASSDPKLSSPLASPPGSPSVRKSRSPRNSIGFYHTPSIASDNSSKTSEEDKLEIAEVYQKEIAALEARIKFRQGQLQKNSLTQDEIDECSAHKFLEEKQLASLQKQLKNIYDSLKHTKEPEINAAASPENTSHSEHRRRVTSTGRESAGTAERGGSSVSPETSQPGTRRDSKVDANADDSKLTDSRLEAVQVELEKIAQKEESVGNHDTDNTAKVAGTATISEDRYLPMQAGVTVTMLWDKLQRVSTNTGTATPTTHNRKVNTPG
jgi:hypothetical protein